LVETKREKEANFLAMEENKNNISITEATEIKRIFEAQKANQYTIGNTSIAERKKMLDKLHQAILKYRPDIKEALYLDYGKHPSEVDLTEVFPITTELKHAKRKLRHWLSKQTISTPLALFGSSSFVMYEPKGVVLIISPWNFPFNLTFGPLISAIAAGNTVILKPSEFTPHSSALMKKIVAEIFDRNHVALIEGSIETSQALLALPFNHIFFTGSPTVGKVVMDAAAKHLCSVTLELGGKSPTIVDETANIETAAKRIAWAKFTNNGQVCIAPDYVFVHESKRNLFLQKVQQNILLFYGTDVSHEKSYGRIVNKKQFERLQQYLDDAMAKGAKIEAGGELKTDQHFIPPTVLSNVSDNAEIMQHEIFGPLLPIFSYKNINEVLAKINDGDKPLALYIFSKNNKNINHILNNTRAGGGCINHCAVHYFNTNLPFGGVNNSGIGKGHGFEGFKAFSNARGILKQHIPNALELLLPPYTTFKQKIINFTIKYF